jgi:hypothetical protein
MRVACPALRVAGSRRGCDGIGSGGGTRSASRSSSSNGESSATPLAPGRVEFRPRKQHCCWGGDSSRSDHSAANQNKRRHKLNGGDQRLATMSEPHRSILSRVRWIALFSLFLGLTRSWDAEVTANFLHEVVGNLAMARDGGPLIERWISPPRMVSTFSN